VCYTCAHAVGFPIPRFEEKVLSSLGEDTCLFLIETAEKLSGIIKDEIAEISDSEV